MVVVKIDVRKTIEQNAQGYFAKAQKARKKIKGVNKVLDTIKEKPVQEELAPKKRVVQRKLSWFEKFRWFISSDRFLCVGGRDAATNEIIIKKHAEKDDLVFHTDMAGSPFVVIKAQGKKVPQTTIDEAAQFTASMSKAWKAGLGVLDVFYVAPEQVTKEAQAGEHLARGAFMVRGTTNYLRPSLELAACVVDYEGEKIMMAPSNACKTHAKELVKIVPGKDKPSDVAKNVKKLLGTQEHLDIILRALPAGNSQIKKE